MISTQKMLCIALFLRCSLAVVQSQIIVDTFPVLQTEGRLNIGLKEGEWRVYYPNKVLKNKVFYKEGKRFGPQYSYDNKGRIQQFATFRDDTLDGVFKLYYEGILIEQGQYISGHALGEWTQYYENGAIMSMRDYKQTTELGSYVFYDENGHVVTEGQYYKAQQHGTWKSYHGNGILYKKSHYQYGNRTEKSLTFFSNAALLSESNYQKNLLQGLHISFYINGQIEEIGQYKQGLKEGTWRFFYSNGLINRKLVYKQGLLWFMGTCLDIYGNLLEGGSLEKGNGSVIWYNDKGQKTRCDFYESGKRKGFVLK